MKIYQIIFLFNFNMLQSLPCKILNKYHSYSILIHIVLLTAAPSNVRFQENISPPSPSGISSSSLYYSCSYMTNYPPCNQLSLTYPNRINLLLVPGWRPFDVFLCCSLVNRLICSIHVFLFLLPERTTEILYHS